MTRIAVVCGWLALAAAPVLAQYGPQRPGADPWRYGGGRPGNWDNSWNNRPNPRAGACFYADLNFRGNHFCVRHGDRLTSLPGNFGDNITSIQVFGRGSVRVFDDRNFRGPSTVFRGSVPDLRTYRSRPGHTWNDRISSIQLR